jgi:two-component system, OmpR family, aerobic respiration control sensor histidine kinase ArcB
MITDGRKLKFLIVEDLEIAQKMAIMTMSPLNCNIDVASTGKEALTKTARIQYDLIFMDLGLPDMDGLTVAETIRESEETSDARTPIIALTAHVSKKFRKSTIESGMNDFLPKPLTLNHAKKMIDKYVISGMRAISV